MGLSITNGTELGGTIPTELAKLTDLRRLWLYNNQLTGSVPSELNQLTELEVVELHNNDLKGEMPQTICTTVFFKEYKHKSLTADCEKVACDNCCTKCPDREESSTGKTEKVQTEEVQT